MLKNILTISAITLLSFSMEVLAGCSKTDVPATMGQLKCLVQHYNENPDRCAGGIGNSECQLIRQRAFEANMIDTAGRTFLEKGGYYPLPNLATGAVGAVCKCGCFDASTEIYTYEMGVIPVSELLVGDSVNQLSNAATLNAIELQPAPIELVLSGEEKTDMYQFKLDNGVLLKLTQHHGVLLSSGQMIAAKDVTLKDQLVDENGYFISIQSIDLIAPSKRVYNFEVQGDTKKQHIISAEGILVGDVAWQNQYAQDLNAILLRND
jgi:hypothetical protein